MALKNFKQVRKETQSVTEGKRPGLWDNIHAKRKRIKSGSGERMRKPGSKGAPTAAALKASQTEEAEQIDELNRDTVISYAARAEKDVGKKHKELTSQIKANNPISANKTADKIIKRYSGMDRAENRLNKEEVEEVFDLIEDVIEDIAKENNVDSDVIWEDLKDISDEDLFEVAAWQRKEGKNPKGGLNAKGIASYRRENPGSKLQMAVTTKPSKLKPGSKAANRRKSFCARMGGMKKRLTSAETARDPDSRINKALRKWNC